MSTNAVSLLTNLYVSREVNEVMLNITPAWQRDEVKHEAFLTLYEKAAKEPAKIIDLHDRNKLKPYVVKTIYNTANFSNSLHNRRNRRKTEIPTESIVDHAEDQEPYDYEALVEFCSVKTDALYWYHRDLLKLYAELGTYRAVSVKTGIPVQSVWEGVKKAKEQIKRDLWD